MPVATLKRAAQIYRGTKWIVTLLLYAGMFATVPIGRANIPFWPGLPDWIQDGGIGVLVWAIFSLGEAVALCNLRRVGLESALREKRVTERTVPEPSSVYEMDGREARTPRYKLQRLSNIFFGVVWAIFFGLFQFGSIGYESLGITLGYVFLAIIPALIFTSIYRFMTQHPSLRIINAAQSPTAREVLAAVPWSQVSRVEEVRTWNFTNDLSECHLSLRGAGRQEVEELSVPPFQADAIFEEIRTRLT